MENKTKIVGGMNYPIYTKFLGPTNTLGERVKAFTRVPYWLEGHVKNTVTLGWDYSTNGSEMHDRAAAKLAEQLDLLSGPKNDPYAVDNHLVRVEHDAYGFCYVVAAPVLDTEVKQWVIDTWSKGWESARNQQRENIQP